MGLSPGREAWVEWHSGSGKRIAQRREEPRHKLFARVTGDGRQRDLPAHALIQPLWTLAAFAREGGAEGGIQRDREEAAGDIRAGIHVLIELRERARPAHEAVWVNLGPQRARDPLVGYL